MGLYIIQHGEAVPESIEPARPLTESGRADVLKMAAFLNGKIKVDIIWHSTKLRARQTADFFAEVFLPAHGLLEKQGLAPNDPVQNIKEDILNVNHEHLMIVGHLPFLSRLASLLLTGADSGSHIVFRPGGVVYLEPTGEGTWSVAWTIIPELI